MRICLNLVKLSLVNCLNGGKVLVFTESINGKILRGKKSAVKQKPQNEQGIFWSEAAFREREILVLEREQGTKEAELEIKRNEIARSGWRSPLVIAIIVAGLAALGNAGVAVINGIQQRVLEQEKAEQARILEMVKTGDPDKAAENLEFLVKAGLISNIETEKKIKKFLATRRPGTGPTLASAVARVDRAIYGKAYGFPVAAFPVNHPVRRAAEGVGRIRVDGQGKYSCAGFLVGVDLVLTSGYCVTKKSISAEFLIGPSGIFEVVLPPPWKIKFPSIKLIIRF